MTYAFLTTALSSVAPNSAAPTLRDNICSIEISGVNIAVRDVVHMRYKENGIPKGVYGICTFSDTDGVTPNFSFVFDQNIYLLFNNISQSDFMGLDIYRNLEYEKVSYYAISTKVLRSNYSDELKLYNTAIDHKLSINNEGREFFGSFKDVMVSDKIIFADYCNNYSYGVSLDEETFNNKYNKFRKSINFNIANR